METVKFNDKAIVTRGNQLIEANYKLTSLEQKLVIAIISTINPEDNDFKKIKMKISELAEFLELTRTDKEVALKQATKDLLTRVLVLNDFEGDKLLQTHWVQSALYYEGAGYVEFELDINLKPYLLKLKQAFTSIRAKNLIKFKGVYSIRIYELCFQYLKIGKREFEIEKLKSILGLEKKEYVKLSNFKNRIIEPALKEINLKSPLNIEVDYLKTGRKVTGIVFKFKSKNEKNNVEIESNFSKIEGAETEEKANVNLINELSLFTKLSYDESKELIKKYGEEYIKINLEYGINNAKNNRTSYIIQAIENDWANYMGKQSEIEKIKKRNEEIEKQQLKILEQEEQSLFDEKDIENSPFLKEYREKNKVI